ncbi:MAG: hypothetical protein QM820_44545 [Minicystis sp.]
MLKNLETKTPLVAPRPIRPVRIDLLEQAAEEEMAPWPHTRETRAQALEAERKSFTSTPDYVDVRTRAGRLGAAFAPWYNRDDRSDQRAKAENLAAGCEAFLAVAYRLQAAEQKMADPQEVLALKRQATTAEQRVPMPYKLQVKQARTVGEKIAACERGWQFFLGNLSESMMRDYDNDGRPGFDAGSVPLGPFGRPGLVGRRPTREETTSDGRDTLWLQGHGDFRRPAVTAQRSGRRRGARSGVEGGFFTMQEILAAANAQLTQRLAPLLQSGLVPNAPTIDPDSVELCFAAPHGTPSKTSPAQQRATAGPFDLAKLNEGKPTMPYVEMLSGSDRFHVPNYSLGHREVRHEAPEHAHAPPRVESEMKGAPSSSARNFGVADMPQQLRIGEKASLYDIMIHTLVKEATKRVSELVHESKPVPAVIPAGKHGRKLRFAWVNCRVETASPASLREEL